MAKTILELAKELNVSKQAIRYHFSDIDDKYFGKRRDGAILLSKEAEEIIRNNMNQPQSSEVASSGKQIKNGQVNSQEETIQWLLAELDAKNDQINQKDKQIKRKDNQIDGLSQRIQELTTLISRDQVLLERTMQPLKSDTNEQNKKPPKSSGDSDGHEITNDSVDTNFQKKNWFQRLFKL